MEQYKKEFIDFMLESKVLKFGDFTLKPVFRGLHHECLEAILRKS